MFPLRVLEQVILVEEDDNQRTQRLNNERRFLRDRSDPFGLSNTKFVVLFRRKKDMVQYLIQRLTPYMNIGEHSRSIHPTLQIFVTLAFYATGCYQTPNGQSFLFAMSQASISRSIRKVTNLIYTHLAHEWITFPTDQLEIERKKAKFFEATTFPGTIGAVDCTHIAIIAPSQEEHNYLNRKGFHSKNVQIICDYDMKILNVNARYAGATHDSYIWRNSIIAEEMERRYNEGDRDTWCIGDSGYPQQPWLMTPITNALPYTPEGRYTAALVKARVSVERCIGLLKERFRCILKERVLHYDPRSVGKIVVACAVLHNICVDGRLPFYPDVMLELGGSHDYDDAEIDENVELTGNLARRRIVDEYF